MLLDCGSALDEVTDVSVYPAPMSATVSELTGLKIPVLHWKLLTCVCSTLTNVLWIV